MDTETAKLFNCRVCHQYLSLPIQRCSKSFTHKFCSACIKQFDDCVICGGNVIDLQDKSFEELIIAFQFECKYQPNGCKERFLLKDKAEHENNHCRYQKYKCEIDKYCKKRQTCLWEGTYYDIKAHFKQHFQQFFMKSSDCMNLKFNLQHPYRFIQLTEKLDEMFWFKMMVHCYTRKVFMAFQLIGSKDNARKYFYDINIFKIDNPNVPFTISGNPCYSHLDNIDEIFQQEDCVVIAFAKISKFLQNDRLMFNFSIKVGNNSSTRNDNVQLNNAQALLSKTDDNSNNCSNTEVKNEYKEFNIKFESNENKLLNTETDELNKPKYQNNLRKHYYRHKPTNNESKNNSDSSDNDNKKKLKSKLKRERKNFNKKLQLQSKAMEANKSNVNDLFSTNQLSTQTPLSLKSESITFNKNHNDSMDKFGNELNRIVLTQQHENQLSKTNTDKESSSNLDNISNFELVTKLLKLKEEGSSIKEIIQNRTKKQTTNNYNLPSINLNTKVEQQLPVKQIETKVVVAPSPRQYSSNDRNKQMSASESIHSKPNIPSKVNATSLDNKINTFKTVQASGSSTSSTFNKNAEQLLTRSRPVSQNVHEKTMHQNSHRSQDDEWVSIGLKHTNNNVSFNKTNEYSGNQYSTRQLRRNEDLKKNKKDDCLIL